MSRIGDFVRRVADLSPMGGLVPPANDMGPTAPLPGPHVHPSRDRSNTDRISPFGATGTLNYSGYLVPSEYNPDLVRWAALEVYERMRRSDPSVRESLWHMKVPIINAEWTVQPPDDPSDDEREQAEFVRAALFEWLEQPWTEVLEHALTYFDFGHSVFEPVFHAVERALTIRTPVETQSSTQGDPASDDAPEDPEDSGGDQSAEDDEGELAASELPSVPQHGGVTTIPVPLPPDTETKVLDPRLFTTWRRFAPRLPRTLWKWNQDEFGELVSITQTVWVNQKDGTQGYRVLEIPAENVMVFTFDKWGDEWTGLSLLRSAYKPWVMKEMLEKIAMLAYERHGVGYLLGYIPREKEDDTALQSKIGDMLSDMRQDAYAVMPGPKQMSGATGPQGYLVEILKPEGGIPDFEPMLTYFRGEIAGAMLVRFKELGHAATGARATADAQSAVWYNALHACARYLETQFDIAIRRLVDLNYPSVRRYPKLKASGIEARDLLEFAQAVALLVDSEVLAPDLPTRNWARASIDAPREDLQETRARAAYDAAQQAAGAAAAQDPADGKAGPVAALKQQIRGRGAEGKANERSARPRVENAK